LEQAQKGIHSVDRNAKETEDVIETLQEQIIVLQEEMEPIKEDAKPYKVPFTVVRSFAQNVARQLKDCAPKAQTSPQRILEHSKSSMEQVGKSLSQANPEIQEWANDAMKLIDQKGV
jgi:multidrug resistance efflux pump